MTNKEGITREVIDRLGILLKSEMPDIKKVLLDFPEANESLVYPCLSIFSNSPDFEPQMAPYEFESEANAGPNDGQQARTNYLYVVGSYDWKIQIDIWCQNKEQRHKLYDQFFNAFNSQFPIMGLSLNLKEYYNIFCRYDQTGLNYDPDGEAASQRKEWRVKIDLIGNCKAVMSRQESAITDTVIDTDGVNNNEVI